MEKCTICPRKCNIDREERSGFCGVSWDIKVARCAPHMWEEDCISGTNGSGAVFFSGCNLRCVYCQNYNVSTNALGWTVTAEELADEFIRLQNLGVHNINLVTPTHYTIQIIMSLDIARQRGLNIPVVYNCGGYESVETIKMLKGYVDIFLTDFKYSDNEMALRYSAVKDYFNVAKDALDAMFEITGPPVFDESGLIKRGIIVRHLMLPGYIKDSKKVLKYLHDRFGEDIYISIMSQYTPLPHVKDYPEINRRLYPAEYKRLVEYAIDIGIVNGFVQDMETADESFIPEFMGE